MAQLFVPTTGFEPARPCEHHPLKMACLPISPRGLKIQKTKYNKVFYWPKGYFECILNKKS